MAVATSTGSTIATVIAERGPRANNFDAIRLAAAALVLVSHAWPLSTGNNAGEPLFALTRGQATLGNFAVAAFFFVSGLLITQSWQQSRSLEHFARKRALRLFPALIIAVLLTVVVLGPLFTTLAPSAYASDASTWSYLWNILLRTVDTLPGMFASNPFPAAVNGSLWTLPYEVRCYAVIAVLGLAGLLGGWRVTAAVTGLAAVASLVLWELRALAGSWNGIVVALAQQAELFVPFGLGMLAWLRRDSVSLGRLPLFGGLVILAAATQTTLFSLLAAYAMLLIVPTLAYAAAAWPRQITATGDYSYGLYLYAFPVQQTLVALLPGLGIAAQILLALPVTLALAALSWHFVERPALALKAGRITTKFNAAATG